MFKYAFILNSETLNPENYSYEYKNEEFYCRIAATHSMEMSIELAKKLAEEGVEAIDLCGDFDQGKADAIKAAVDRDLEVNYAKYTETEGAKIEALPSLREYGMIILASGVGSEIVRAKLESDECNSYIAFVENEDMAKAAAKDMVREGIYFIELCSYFTEDKAEKIVNAIEGKIPVGYCG